MNGYLVSLLVGLAVGVAYGLVQVRSPAPPMIALIGLLGILLGEQAVGLAKRHLAPVKGSMREQKIVDVLADDRSRPEAYSKRVCEATRSDPRVSLSRPLATGKGSQLS
jgi:XapX domain-containing protein